MGLFRLAAVIAVGVSLLPSDHEKQQQLYNRAASAAEWTLTFCDRNTDWCDKATTAWTEFSTKAKFGAQLAYEVITDNKDDQTTGVIIQPVTTRRALETSDLAPVANAAFHMDPPTGTKTHGTLTPHDRQPQWRGATTTQDPL